MASVETVRGPVELDALGRTLVHEHVKVRCSAATSARASGGRRDRLQVFAATGVHTFRDLPSRFGSRMTDDRPGTMLVADPRRWLAGRPAGS